MSSSVRPNANQKEDSNIDLKGQSTMYEKGSASLHNSQKSATIPMNYESLLKKYS